MASNEACKQKLLWSGKTGRSSRSNRKKNGFTPPPNKVMNKSTLFEELMGAEFIYLG